MAPFRTWAKAARDLQSAIDAADAGDTVLVTNGTYDTGGALTPDGSLMNRIVATNAMTVRSVNGPSVTTLMGQGPQGTASAMRCAYLGNGAVLNGFTLTHGFTGVWTMPPVPERQYGGAVYARNALIQHCIIVGNIGELGGGVYGGTVEDCTISGNHATVGGGLYGGTARQCLITGNSANYGGGGAAIASLRSCTVAGNTSMSGGGGVSQCAIQNSVVYFNLPEDFQGGIFSNSCTYPLPPGVNNITNDPQFVDWQNGDSHLWPLSPCINAGVNQPWMTNAVDLDGNPRILDGRVDIGAKVIWGRIFALCISSAIDGGKEKR